MRFQRVDQLSFMYCLPRSFLIYGPGVNRKMKTGDEFIEFLSIKLHVWCCRWTIDTKYYTADACIWTLDSDGSNAENITEAVFKNCQALCMVFDLSDVRNFSSFYFTFRDVVGAVYITNFYRVQALPLHYKPTLIECSVRLLYVCLVF